MGVTHDSKSPKAPSTRFVPPGLARLRRPGACPSPHAGAVPGLLGLLASAAIGACAPDDRERPIILAGEEAPPVVWEGEHVAVGTDLDLANWCPGNLPRLDRYVGALKQVFESPDELLVRYFLFEPPVSALGVCSDGALACTLHADELVGGIVITDALPDDHEIVHAVMDRAPHFLSEGAATYWGGLVLDASPFYYELDIEETFAASWTRRLTGDEYGRAAHFTAYLVDRFGVASYMALLQQSETVHSRAQFEQAFAEVLGLSLRDAFVEYRERDYCNLREMRSTFFDCVQGDPIAVTAAKPVLFEFDLSCDDPEVLGPQTTVRGKTRLWRDVVLDIGPREDPWQVELELPAQGTPTTLSIYVRPCGTDCGAVTAEARFILDDGGQPARSRFEMAPGRYVMRLSRSVDESGPVRFWWR